LGKTKTLSEVSEFLGISVIKIYIDNIFTSKEKGRERKTRSFQLPAHEQIPSYIFLFHYYF